MPVAYTATGVHWFLWFLRSCAITVATLTGAIGNSGNGNRKWKVETENGNSQNLNARVKPLITDHLLKTTSLQRPPLHKDHIAIRFQRWLRYA